MHNQIPNFKQKQAEKAHKKLPTHENERTRKHIKKNRKGIFFSKKNYFTKILCTKEDIISSRLSVPKRHNHHNNKSTNHVYGYIEGENMRGKGFTTNRLSEKTRT